MAEHPINAATHPNGDEGRAGSRRRGRLGRSAARLAPQPVLQKRPRYRGAGLGSHLRQQPRASNPASPVRPGLPRAPSPTPPEAPLFPGVGGSSWGSPALSGCFNPRIPWPHGQFRTSLCEKAPTPPPGLIISWRPRVTPTDPGPLPAEPPSASQHLSGAQRGSSPAPASGWAVTGATKATLSQH